MPRILTVHLNLSLFILRQIATARESKQTHRLISFGSRCVFAQGRFDFMSFSLVVELPGEVDAGVSAIRRGNDSVGVR